jgi:hypothetical protein
VQRKTDSQFEKGTDKKSDNRFNIRKR